MLSVGAGKLIKIFATQGTNLMSNVLVLGS
jgi:hypothetical protein